MTDPSVFRVIAMDGGDGQVTALLLQELARRLNEKHPQTGGKFLDSVLLYTGSSAGGINSLLIANQVDPDAFVQTRLPTLWQQLLLAMLPLPPMPAPQTALDTHGPFGALLYPAQLAQYVVQLGLSLVGLHNVVNNDKIKAILTSQFASQTLRDLKKTVAVVSFQLDSGEAQDRRWIPRVFTNIPASIQPGNKDLEELCVDVGLRTSAQPIYFPVYQGSDGAGPGYIDGGYVANNPGMVAIARALEVVHSLEKTGTPAVGAAAVAPIGNGLDAFAAARRAVAPPSAAGAAPTPPQGRVLMLSLGAGTTNTFPGPNYIGPEQLKFFGGSATWGYVLWLLNPTQPFVLLNALLSAQMEEVSFQLENVLNAPGLVPSYYRLSPTVKNSREIPSEELKRQIIDAQGAAIDAAVEWLVSSGWVSTSGT